MERKQAVLKKMLPPNNMALRQLSREEGISEATLHKWRTAARGKGRLLPDTGPGGWSSRDKFAAVVETAAMNVADLAEYCKTACLLYGGLTCADPGLNFEGGVGIELPLILEDRYEGHEVRSIHRV